MSHHLVFPELFQLEQLALHNMAKKLWNTLVLQNRGEIFIKISQMDTFNDLSTFKARVINALPGLLPQGFPKFLKDKLVDEMVDIILGYDAAFEWILSHHALIKLSQDVFGEDLAQKCEGLLYSATSPNIDKYEAIHFIRPLGRFDDLSWAKLFVTDNNQSLKSRFYLACMYCFEEEIHSLWCAMKRNNQTLSQKDMQGINRNSMLLINLWISRLEKEIGDSFYVDGFKLAFDWRREHGVIFFWRHCSDNEKATILSELKLCSVSFLSKLHAGFVHFIYSLLSEQLKDKHRLGIFLCDEASVLVFLLCSSYYNSILNDILAFPLSVPSVFRKYIIRELFSVISKYSITLHKEIFKILWNALLSEEERIDILDSSYIHFSLIEINDLSLLETIVLPLPLCAKEKLLLNYFERACNLFSDSHYKIFHCYLLFLLLDYDAVSGKLILRSDAANLLDRFMDTHKNRFSEYFFKLSRRIKRVTEHLKVTFPVIEELINRMDHASDFLSFPTITHDFLSREIYPLLPVKDNDLKREEKKEQLFSFYDGHMVFY